MGLLNLASSRRAARIQALQGQAGTLARAALRRAGLYETDGGAAKGTERDRSALDLLVARGVLTADDARAALLELYPGQAWAGGEYGDQEPQEEPEGESFHVERLPDSYEPEAVQRSIQRLSDQITGAFGRLVTNPPPLAAHTIDGTALKPGTTPPEALDMQRVGRELLALPGPEEAIRVQTSRSASMDRFVRRTSTGVAGPGRILKAADAQPSLSSRVGFGPARYRIVEAGLRMGVMSCRQPAGSDTLASPETSLLVQYGVVIAGIEHFLGRPPSRLLALESVGDSPVPFGSEFLSGGDAALWAATRDHYWTRTKNEHQGATVWPFGEAMGSDPILSPSAADLRDMRGFAVHLITGRTAGEVFRQLCSRQSLGRTLRADGAPPARSVPSGLPLEGPCPSSVVDLTAGPVYTHLFQAADLTAASRRIVSGVPFSYQDCAALVPTDGRFSVVVTLAQERMVSTNPLPAAWATPEAWHQYGVVLRDSSAGNLRKWALDIIVD